jgi:glycosyltransferase involved in cell wall biosynthesis
MRIAQVAPLFESVPPAAYGGTERIVSYLTEELVRRGHEVTLFASGDSHTAGRLVASCERSLRQDAECTFPDVFHLIELEQLYRQRSRFDVIHFHIDQLQYPLARRYGTPHVTTMHGRLDIRDLEYLYKEFPEAPVVSISDAQRRPLPWLNWRGTVYHGLPSDLFRFHEHPQDYVAFLGRVSPEKGLAPAIEIARRAGLPLKVAAKIDVADRDFFEQDIRPLLDDPLVSFMGEVGGTDKEELLGNARAVLFPIEWPEPFGLVMIESFACGTPVIAFPHGSVPEVMRDGVSGFVVDGVDEAVRALERVTELDRRACRRYFEDRFTDEKMVDGYLSIYEQLAASGARPSRRKRHPRRSREAVRAAAVETLQAHDGVAGREVVEMENRPGE